MFIDWRNKLSKIMKTAPNQTLTIAAMASL
jgi:hypothetical protein